MLWIAIWATDAYIFFRTPYSQIRLHGYGAYNSLYS